MTRSAALCAALLAPAACASGAPDDDLVGTWTFASVTNQQLATVSRTQTVVDMTRPTSGAFALDGSETGTTPFLHGYYRYGTSSWLSVGSFDPSSAYPSSRQFVTLWDSDGATSVNVRREGDYESHEYALDGLSGVRKGAAYTLAHTVPSYYDSEASVRVSGTFTMGNRTLTAGQPTALSVYEYTFPSTSTARYSFEPGGVLKVQQVEGNRVTTRTGTWTRTGDRVVLTAQEGDGVTVSYEYGVSWEGSTLLLTVDQDSYACTADCLRYAEEEFGIEPGTLTQMRTEEVLYLRPYTAGASARTAEAAPAGPPLPAPLRARIGLRVLER